MTLFGKYKQTIAAAVGLAIVYFATRLYNIMSLPMFTDEAIYTRWSQIAEQDASWRFISLTDGKQPSFVWLDMATMKFVEDPLLAGRLVSVGAGFFALVGIYFLARELFKSNRIGLIACAIYIIFPFSLVYDRMALYDSLVGAISIWSLYFEVLLIRRRRLDIALILGMVLGFGVLTKSSAFLAVYLLPFSLILFDFKQKKAVQQFIKWLPLVLISVVMTFGIYSMLRLSPFFYIIEEKTRLFVFPIYEWLKHPLEFLYSNMSGLQNWLLAYFTIPGFAVALASFLVDKKKFFKEKLFLLIWFLLPFMALALFGKTLYPRFILFMTMPLLVLLAFSINFVWENVKNTIFKYGLIIASIAMMLISDFYIVFNFAYAPIAKPDTDQFVNSWPAGGGVREIISFFTEHSKNQKIYVATEGTFGSLSTYSVEIYLGENKNIDKRGIYPLPSDIPKDLLDRAKTMPVYLVVNDSENAPPSWPLRLLNRFQKGIGDRYMSLYEVIPSN